MRRLFQSTQSIRIDLEHIEDDVVFLKGGRSLAVLEVGSINFALKGETDQQGVIAAYASCLNGLTFPLQVLVRVLPVDVEEYLADVQQRARADLPPRLAELARDHVLFVRRLARNRTLLERRFYAVIPSDDGSGYRFRWPWSRQKTSPGDADGVRQKLSFRVAELERQLTSCGLTVRRLRDAALLQLHYACWCPELSRVQRLRRDLAGLTAMVVRGQAPERRLACSA